MVASERTVRPDVRVRIPACDNWVSGMRSEGRGSGFRGWGEELRIWIEGLEFRLMVDDHVLKFRHQILDDFGAGFKA